MPPYRPHAHCISIRQCQAAGITGAPAIRYLRFADVFFFFDAILIRRHMPALAPLTCFDATAANSRQYDAIRPTANVGNVTRRHNVTAITALVGTSCHGHQCRQLPRRHTVPC